MILAMRGSASRRMAAASSGALIATSTGPTTIAPQMSKDRLAMPQASIAR